MSHKQPNALLFAKSLNSQGQRVFTTTVAKEVYSKLGLKAEYVNIFLSNLKQRGWIHSLRRGLYVLDDLFLEGIPINEFEVAMALVNNGCISFYSAFHYHGLTEQLPRTIFISIVHNTTVPLEKSKPRCTILGIEYRFIKLTKELFFGHQERWINNAKKVTITDLERTLLDGLRSPQYCGGFQEVLHAFQISKDKIHKEKIIGYAEKMGPSVVKRLGYILEKLDVETKYLDPLLNIPSKGYNRLDPSRPKAGSYNKTWMIIENV